MSKDSAAWLAIRIMGLLLLGEALLFLFSAISQVLVALKAASITSESLASQATRVAIHAWVDAGIASAETITIGLLAVYFLRGGKAIHKLLMRESR
jgi:hypothetical protein